ncbi:MAG: hypothetical protein ACAI34_13280 [Verrucomicrobium sp.]|nr:hypothetical protein [Verrucomicrobium sp.]
MISSPSSDEASQAPEELLHLRLPLRTSACLGSGPTLLWRALALPSLLLLSLLPAAAQPRPSIDFQNLVVPARSPTWGQLCPPLQRWYEKTWQMEGLRNPTLPELPDAKWQAFVKAAIARRLFLPESPSERQLELMAMELVDYAHQHPVAGAVVGDVLKEQPVAKFLLLKSFEKLSQQPGQETLSFMVACLLAESQFSDVSKKGDSEAAYDRAINALGKSLEKDPGWSDYDDNIIEDLLSLNGNPELIQYGHESIFNEAVAAPRLKSWAVRWMEGRHLALAASGSVSTGYSPGSKDSSRIEGDEARLCYEAALKEKPRCSGPACDLVALALQAQGAPSPVEDMLTAVSRAMTLEVDAFHHHSWLMRALQPDWYGSHREMLRYGRVCLDSGRFDSFLPYRYLDVHRAVRSDLGDPADYFLNLDFTPMQRLFEGFETEPSRALWRSYDRTRAAAVSFACGRHREAALWLSKLPGPPDAAALESWGNLEAWQLLGETAALVGPRAVTARDAATQSAGGNPTQALALYHQLLSEKPESLPAAERRFYEKRAVALDFETTLARDHAAALKVDPEFIGWTAQGGGWILKEDGSLEMGGKVLRSRATHLGRVDMDTTVEGQVEWSTLKDFSQVWIVLATMERQEDDPVHTLGFMVQSGRMTIRYSQQGAPATHQAEVVASPRCQFAFKVTPDGILLHVDGKEFPLPTIEKKSEIRSFGNMLVVPNYADPAKQRLDAALHVELIARTAHTGTRVRLRDLRVLRR